MIRIAINGFGRIGRQAFKIAFERDDIEVVAINDLAPIEASAHLLVYDSVYGIYPNDVRVEVDGNLVSVEGAEPAEEHKETFEGKDVKLIVDEKKIKMLSIPEPENLPWKELGVDVVLECTGVFTKNRAAEAHVKAGAKKVVISAPAKGEGNVGTYLMGVNNDVYDGDSVISNGSCTTNCVGPVAKVMYQNFGVKKALMTTIHSYTASQNLVDGYSRAAGKDMRRSRAAAFNIVPTTTGAAIATTEAIPELKEKFDGLAVRVPTICGSLTDFTFLVEKGTTIQEVNKAFIDSSESKEMDGILEVTTEPIVSSDILGNPASAIIDLSLTKVVDGDLVKIMAWYDNEVGYSYRLVEMAKITMNDE